MPLYGGFYGGRISLSQLRAGLSPDREDRSETGRVCSLSQGLSSTGRGTTVAAVREPVVAGQSSVVSSGQS